MVVEEEEVVVEVRSCKALVIGDRTSNFLMVGTPFLVQDEGTQQVQVQVDQILEVEVHVAARPSKVADGPTLAD
jgi:hypothetical protein